MNLNLIPESLRREAETLRRYQIDNPIARALESCAEMIEEGLRLQDEEVLTIQQAAAISGFSADHLRRLVTQGKIPNAGRKGSPKIRRGDLSRKPHSKSGAVASRRERSDTVDGLFRDIIASKIGVN